MSTGKGKAKFGANEPQRGFVLFCAARIVSYACDTPSLRLHQSPEELFPLLRRNFSRLSHSGHADEDEQKKISEGNSP